jgi:hypothetical protein
VLAVVEQPLEAELRAVLRRDDHHARAGKLVCDYNDPAACTALDADGMFRIGRRVAPDRVISTVDPQARHGHKTSAHGFHRYKRHLAVDPDSEIITATAVTPGNVGDAGAAGELLAADIPSPTTTECAETGSGAEPEPGSVGTGATGPADAPLAVCGMQPLAVAVDRMMPSLGNGADGSRQQPPGGNGKVDAVDGDLAGG